MKLRTFSFYSEVKQGGVFMKYFYQTDIGSVRSSNQDNVNIFTKKDMFLAIVADGMGGHNAGEIASEMTVASISQAWETLKKTMKPTEAESWLIKKIEETNEIIYQYATENVACEGMGTTIVAAICTSGFASICHIGDSRCYMLSKNGFHQITEDHSYVNYLLKTGEISKEDAENHPRKNVLTKALGTKESVKPDVKSVSFEEGDKILICTDGLYSLVENDLIESMLQADEPLSYISQNLINAAKENGGDDNISVIILQQSTSDGEEEAS